ncbi:MULTISPECIES: 2OG-Fe(II) oxygenase [unclassified Mucilaginibacter]|uniref:2OG-Fe(II) oxygenase n=1 Tax=unclassified Mucilaginibacter TaxID=2617802 RepID=UPI002AC9B30B|nr:MULTISPECIES: 2OG-Fe(II) oxygenase [unclassified Mucilaginibacter]MEB0249469.1 2OG-Fe(II) oxygenase [Mucilaginibacter sp. 5B2]MEB0260607.1 2OG-Fe(II) oxygenase [Mucilaginibacter sp. 10I4]MEB0278037.1 2OG-Fe(II) oxygenase [Mucilaginibacter sp. 10B2]MEB0299609.1 2OG-Fe(II) oxygenase [Mucilaginibacter sp. 5C4]WPX22926.1 2OG-Fe(II) oxygenase [Mucilaginibacter sp. 5C4]
MELQERISQVNWVEVAESMHAKGYAPIPNILSADECDELIDHYADETGYRKTIVMEHHGYGLGQYKYYSYPLPGVVQQLREAVYPNIVPIANKWMEVLNINKQFPATLNELTDLCHQHGQLRPTPLILKYNKGGYNAIHQDLYGEVYFPMQLVVCLSEPGEDFEGGEFVLVEQRPRMQSKAIVLNPKKGDVLLFTTNFRPVMGTRGYYRVNMKHGVSEVTLGDRHTLGIIFHDAT